jgi:predicted phosphodiesterase
MSDSPQQDDSPTHYIAGRDNDELFAKALELAPRFDTLANVGRAVNDALDIDISASAWRGLFQRNPEQRERIRKRLGTQAHSYQRTITINGNVTGIVFSDIHAPYHDRNAIALAAKIAAWWRPDVAIYNGDDVDFYQLSRFDKNPNRTARTQDEIDTWHVECVAPLNQALGKARKIKVSGNHEDRLRRKLWANPDLFGIPALELPELMQLRRYGIEYAELRVRFGTLLEVTHGTRVSKWAGYTARLEQEQRRYSINTITGHVHRAGRFQTRIGSSYVVGQECPCLCTLDPEYMTDPDWTQGVTLFTVRDGAVQIEPVIFSPTYTAMIGKQFFSL